MEPSIVHKITHLQAHFKPYSKSLSKIRLDAFAFRLNL